MYYDFGLTVPANTPTDSPYTQDVVLSAGIIHRVEVEYRFGPNHQVGLRIFQGGHQLWPTNPDSDFRGNGRAIVIDEHYEIVMGAHILRIEAYSPGTAYDHQVFVRFGILDAAQTTPLGGLAGGLQKLLSYIGIKGQ